MLIELEECGKKLEESFPKLSRKAICLGHFFMAAPNPILICLGSIIAGIGWLASRINLRYALGAILCIYGTSLGATTLLIGVSQEGEEALITILDGEIQISASTAFVACIMAYGTLAFALRGMGRKINIKAFSCAAISLAFTSIMLLFVGGLVLIALGEGAASESETLLTTLNVALASLIAMNSMGNALVGLGFVVANRHYGNRQRASKQKRRSLKPMI